MLQESYPEALDHFNKSYEISSSLGSQLNVGFDLALRADASWRLGRYKEAQADLNKAAAIAERPDGVNKQLSSRINLIRSNIALSERQFVHALSKSRNAIALDDSPTQHVAIEALSVLCLAQSLSGARAEGKQSCVEAGEKASHASDPRLLSTALLALAEALLGIGDFRAALNAALQAQERFARNRQQESEWRSYLIAGAAGTQLNETPAAREQVLNASTLVSGLQQRWGTDHFNSYLSRPDISYYRKQLDNTLLFTK
jgi:tetratricopeptide (TPR) repeat protein